ncbi:MAG: hypothetical protein KatS3mg111_0390 [Pirellulaceae bacterium]|nr:MAG: hypothetical protein KatS3mg111_0390 [Pirellulaceae bacterium]
MDRTRRIPSVALLPPRPRQRPPPIASSRIPFGLVEQHSKPSAILSRQHTPKRFRQFLKRRKLAQSRPAGASIGASRIVPRHKSFWFNGLQFGPFAFGTQRSLVQIQSPRLNKTPVFLGIPGFFRILAQLCQLRPFVLN